MTQNSTASKEKLPEERWADYTARRLEEEGIDLTPYVAVDGFENGLYDRVYSNSDWKLHIGFSVGTHMFKVGTKNQPHLKLSLELEEILEESVNIFLSCKEDTGIASFTFKGDNIIVGNLEYIIGELGPLDKYGAKFPAEGRLCKEELPSYPAKDFVENLVLFAKKELKGNVNLAYQDIENFVYR